MLGASPPRAARAGPMGEPGRRRPLIILDPGHGGHDPGATGVAGTLEKHITLASALVVKAGAAGARAAPRRVDPHPGPLPARWDDRVESPAVLGADPVPVDARGPVVGPGGARRFGLHPGPPGGLTPRPRLWPTGRMGNASRAPMEACPA